MIAALAVGHAGKILQPFDRGCSFKHHSGVLLREVPLARAYASAIDDELLRHGSIGVLLCDGSYDDRALRAKAMAADCLLACHANAGLRGRDGQRAEFYYWPGNDAGAELAEALATELMKVVPYDARVVPAEEGPMLESARVASVRSTIDGAAYPSVCVEPFFVDAKGADKMITPDFLIAVGAALAQGMLRWKRGT
jgi:N-acetylmuramoyl-L-alanine amidase